MDENKIYTSHDVAYVTGNFSENTKGEELAIVAKAVLNNAKILEQVINRLAALEYKQFMEESGDDDR